MGKNVAVFVDVANIFYAAKAAGVDIDYVTLLKASSAGRDLVRAYAYTGLDPDNENQRNFHDFLRRHGYRVVSKDIRKYGDGKVKANLDIELVVDMLKTARNLDVAIVVSGDGDFAPAIRAVQEMGVRVEVVSFRGNTSSDLMDVADQFSDITQIAKVEKGSSRSGRRVAGDEADLSMTEVPDKQSEGTGERGRGRGRSRRTSETAVAATRGRSRRAAAAGEPALVALPGEKLSKVAAPVSADGEDDAAAGEDLEPVVAEGEAAAAVASGEPAGEEGQPRRRRRRGGRGRGRGRGREEGYAEDVTSERPDDADAEEDDVAAAPSRPRPASTFGSVWDSQIGMPAAASSAPGTPLEDDEDLEEPAIPEYLLAERRRRDGGRGRGGRGRGGAYAAALERERFGGGRGGGISRYAEPPRSRDSGGGRREPGPSRAAGRPAGRGAGNEPWSEVPPEIEAMLRAQLGAPTGRQAPRPTAADGQPAVEDEAAAATEASAPARGRGRAAAGRGRGRAAAKTAEVEAQATAEASAETAAADAAPAKPVTRRRSSRTAATKATAGEGSPETEAPAEKPKRTTRARKPTAAAQDADDATEATEGEAKKAAPRRRTTRKKAEPAS